MSSVVGKVDSLWRYPVKSMLGEQVRTVEVTQRGLVGDRCHAVWDEASGKAASAKSPRKWAGLFEFRAALDEAAVAGDAVPSARITFPDGTVVGSGEERLGGLLSREFGRPVSLRSAPADGSVSAYEYDQAEEDRGDGAAGEGPVTEMPMPAETYFDEGAVNLLSSATLRELSALHPQGTFAVRRFRPNVVLDLDEEGFVEERWVGRTLLIGDEVRLRVTGPTPRCVMVNLYQEGLPKDPTILRTVAQRNGGNAGIYAAVTQGGRINSGDQVMVD